MVTVLHVSAVCAAAFFAATLPMFSQSAPPPDVVRSVCGTCHQVPSPMDLDRASWKNVVLPRMGQFLGRYATPTEREGLLEGGSARPLLLERDIYPEEPRVDDATWAEIVKYYLDGSPEQLPPIDTFPIHTTDRFTAIRPVFMLKPPSTTSVVFDSVRRAVFLGDAFTGRLFGFDERLQQRADVETGESPVCITMNDTAAIVTVMGQFSPTDAPTGTVQVVSFNGSKPSVLIDQLQRPVHHAVSDLDGDGREDLVVCEFAKWTGGLSWWKNRPDGTYERRLLLDEPGAIRTEVRDWDHDGDPDIIALFAQGNECIRWFRNDGTGVFTDTVLLQFPPSWGSSSFSLVDVNGDGIEDIVHCAGDNADFGPIEKPYHGIRIYRRNSNGSFQVPQFLPLRGAYGTRVHDFDADGDLDIAAISFFPDFTGNRPEEGFVYLENEGDWTFNASTFPEVGRGRWIVLDRGDIDGDGDQDLFLGSLTFEVPGRADLVEQWSRDGIAFILLENQTR